MPQPDSQTNWLEQLIEKDKEVAELQAENKRLLNACSQQNHEICQTLGKVLNYPWFKDDQQNFPNATEADGVCVGEHVAETLAEEAAKKIAKLRKTLQNLACLQQSICETGLFFFDKHDNCYQISNGSMPTIHRCLHCLEVYNPLNGEHQC